MPGSNAMPAGQPFTRLCQLLSRPALTERADLHMHSTFSDGLYTPAQLVDLAKRSGLAAIALTDHDTLAGVEVLQRAAEDSGVEIVPGVEISCAYASHEVHILAYFVDMNCSALTDSLDNLKQRRRERFLEMVERLKAQGVELNLSSINGDLAVLGRRNLADLLVAQRKVSTVREAFLRYLGNNSRATVPKQCLPVEEALQLVRTAGGIASWAHPWDRDVWPTLVQLTTWGLGAVEAEYPTHRPTKVQTLRRMASELKLAITGGSDCHGPGEPRRVPGARSVTRDELDRLRPKVRS